MWTLVAVLAATCFSSTVAVAPCSKYPDIPGLLGKIKECYKDGKPPQNLVGYGVKFTVNYISNDVLPAGVKCVVGQQQTGVGLVNFTVTQSASPVKVTYEQQVKDKYIYEKDPKGIYYNIWPITNQNYVYFYYRCIASEGENGSGSPMAALYVKCGYENSKAAKQEIDRALACVKKLNINNLTQMTPCQGCGSK